jgi:membrane dipeptidase
MRVLLCSLLGLSLLFAAEPNPSAPTRRKKIVVGDEAKKIHAEALLVDGHNDLPWQFRVSKDMDFRIIDLRKNQKEFHTDIPRLRAGNVGCQFWAAYVPSSTDKKRTAVTQTLEQIDVIRRLIERYPDTFEMADTADDILRIRKAGKIASLIGVEGGHSIDSSLGVLRIYHRLGVRYMTLTHSESLEWADSATDKPRCEGLSPFGERVVAEMNRLGMLVDISHVSAECMRKVLKVTKAPVIASHSSAFALADHPRNVPDDVLKLVKANGGVVMVNFYSGFITPEGVRVSRRSSENYRKLRAKYPKDEEFKLALETYRKENPLPPGSVHDVVAHIDHIVKVAGIDHVGIGSDFDGIDSVPRELEDVSKYPVLTQALLDKGYTREQIHKILGGNALRVLREAEKVAKSSAR